MKPAGVTRSSATGTGVPSSSSSSWTSLISPLSPSRRMSRGLTIELMRTSTGTKLSCSM
jgi:hypothetical protein